MGLVVEGDGTERDSASVEFKKVSNWGGDHPRFRLRVPSLFVYESLPSSRFPPLINHIDHLEQ
jgi:hypothetical protein